MTDKDRKELIDLFTALTYATVMPLLYAFGVQHFWNEIIPDFVRMQDILLRVDYWEAYWFVLFASLVYSSIKYMENYYAAKRRAKGYHS